MLVRADDKDIKRRKSYMERCFTIYEEKILWWFSIHLVKVSKSFQYKKDIHVISSTYLFNYMQKKGTSIDYIPSVCLLSYVYRLFLHQKRVPER